MTRYLQGDVIAPGFRLEFPVGYGGLGTVWAATDLAMGRLVALKWVTLANHTPELRRRLVREARVGMGMSHNNVATVHELIDADPEHPMVVMELLRGESLRAKLTRELRLSLSETLRTSLPVMAAVTAAHALGIVHRDLKPENVFLAEQDGGIVPKVLDFGIAKLTAMDGTLAASGALTSTGTVMGTLAYMAPEQLKGEPVDHRADIWSMGVILYECLTGGRPVAAWGYGQMLHYLLTTAITPLEVVDPSLPPVVCRTVARMLARAAVDRLPNMREAMVALEAVFRAE